METLTRIFLTALGVVIIIREVAGDFFMYLYLRGLGHVDECARTRDFWRCKCGPGMNEIYKKRK